MRKRCRASLAPALQKLAHLVILLTLAASSVHAHDRHGNAAMNQDVHVLIAKDHVDVTFQIETNEEGAIIEAIAMDANGDGKLSPEEQSAYFAQLDARLREGLQFIFCGKDVPLSPSTHVDLAPPSRKTFHFRGPVDSGLKNPGLFFAYNDNFLDWPGPSKLTIETSDEVHKFVEHVGSLFNGSSGVITLHDRAKPLNSIVAKIDWEEWAWPRRLIAPVSIKLFSSILMLVACVIVLLGRHSTMRNVAGTSMIALSVTGIAFGLLMPRNDTAPSESWQKEFLLYHENLMVALGGYHQDGSTTLLAPLVSPAVATKLTKATRVADPHEENTSAFELHRVRPLATTVLSTPHPPFNSTFRVHHEWRAIGVMRHQGHPHERVRDFACDYTLRATSHRLELLDCSDWHQLPDEPVE